MSIRPIDPYTFLKPYLKAQGIIDIIQDYVTYHQNLYFSLRLERPDLFPKLELSSVKILARQHEENPRGFSYPYVLFQKTIYSIISGESRALPPYPLEGLSPPYIICRSGISDGLLMLSAYSSLIAKPAHSALIVSFYRIADLFLLGTTIFPINKVYHNGPQCYLRSRNMCVVNLLDDGYRFMNPQTGEFLPPPFWMNPGQRYEFFVLNEEGMFYAESEPLSCVAETHFTYGTFARAITYETSSRPLALMGPHFLQQRHAKTSYFASYHMLTKSFGLLVGLGIPYDLHVDQNWVLFTDCNKGKFTLSLSKFGRVKENPSSSGGCVIS